MKTHYTIAMAMLAGFGLGTVAVQGLHAQAKVPVYQVTEVEILNPEGYAKDYVPKAGAAVRAAGGKFLAVAERQNRFRSRSLGCRNLGLRQETNSFLQMFFH